MAAAQITKASLTTGFIVKTAMEAINKDGTIPLQQIKHPEYCRQWSGISTEEGAQLFSQFFSTKKDGQGIGLTLVREILMN